MQSQKFSKSKRLLKSSDYKRVLENGIKYYTKYFIVLICDQNLEYNRLGLIFSHKTGNAVVRNRFKRLLREYFRLFQGSDSKGLQNHDVVFIGKKGLSKKIRFQDVRKDCSRLYENHSGFIHSYVSAQPLTATA